MVQGSLVGNPLPVSFFLFSSVSASVAWDEVGCFTLYAATLFLFFPLLAALSLALMRTDSTLAGIGSRTINK